ncbi:MAG TPA: 16S rRNA (guanine(966)-N(2))-methyltransferase RsmD [Gammaproteobacteria bacterium]|nr:16S rRNA (guanine(966)-N(2))-methyltransferase RsmD [Gammaproteobacteria bacterium]
MTRKQRRVAARKTENTVRIIGGQMRSRKIHFSEVDGLRPSTDRIRETLFNWLQPVLGGANCLDLFAGSGVLGFEALSRGAASVMLVERHAQILSCLREQVTVLELQLHCQVREADVLQWLRSNPEQAYDVIFLDPPYRQDLLAKSCELLADGGWAHPGTRIYLEAERELGEPVLPQGWSLLRSAQAGQTGYFLAEA